MFTKESPLPNDAVLLGTFSTFAIFHASSESAKPFMLEIWKADDSGFDACTLTRNRLHFTQYTVKNLVNLQFIFVGW